MNWFEHGTMWCFLLSVISTLVLLALSALKLFLNVTVPALALGAGIGAVVTFILFVAGFLLRDRFGSRNYGA